MRALHLIAAAAALAFTQSAWAAPVALSPVGFSPKLQTEIQDDLGPREGIYLQDVVTRAVTRALQRSGAEVSPTAPITIEITIIDADPNHPTFDQMGRPPFLDMSSVSLGGAELHAVLRGADGAKLSEVSYRRYDPQLDQIVMAGGTWSGAQRAIYHFAERVADAYRVQSAQR